MKAILIDPANRTVAQIDFEGGYLSIKKAIQCDTITTCTPRSLPRNGDHREDGWVWDTIYLDDEGLLHSDPGPFFLVSGYDQPLAGRGLVVGTTGDGSDTDCQSTVDYINGIVSWPNVEFTGFRSQTREHVNVEGFGPDVTVFEQEALFTEKKEDLATDTQTDTPTNIPSTTEK
jgi:hypothetical protein